SEPRESGLVIRLLKPDGGINREEAAVLDKVKKQLPAALEGLDLTAAEKEILCKAVRSRRVDAGEVYAEEFTIVGVLRLPTEEEQKEPWNPLHADADVYLPLQTATALFFRMPGQDRLGVDHAMVFVDREENVK